MSFTGAYTKTNETAIDKNAFTIADTSSYAGEIKSTFSGRKIYLVDIAGNYIAPASQEVVILGVDPVATITVDSVPADGYNIIVALPAEMGGTSLGSYTKQSSDTTTTILAASIAAALSGTGVTITSALNVITFSFTTETSDYNDLALDISFDGSGGAGAIGYVSFPFGYTLPANGQSITLSLPAEVGGAVLCTYVKQSSDTTREILVASIFNAITFPTGYSGSYNGGDIEIDAPVSVGSAINDLSVGLSTTFTQSPDLTAFFGGVDAPGIIPNTPTDFTGGVTQHAETVSGLDYWDFSYELFPDDEITINTLTYDIALNIYVVWTSTNPQQGSTYTDSQVFDFIDYIRAFMDTMIGNTAANRILNWPENFYEGMSLMQTWIDSSANCIVNNDQYESQQNIDLATEFLTNPNNFY